MTGVAFVPCDAVRWARVSVDVADCASLEEVETRARDALATARLDEADCRPLVARVTLSGRTALHGDLVQRLAVLREDVRALATGISDDLWIEKVALATQSVAAPVGAAPELDEIAAFLEQGLADGELRALLANDYGQLFGRIPPELADDSELLASARSGDFDAILQDAAAALRSRLPEAAG